MDRSTMKRKLSENNVARTTTKRRKKWSKKDQKTIQNVLNIARKQFENCMFLNGALIRIVEFFGWLRIWYFNFARECTNPVGKKKGYHRCDNLFDQGTSTMTATIIKTTITLTATPQNQPKRCESIAKRSENNPNRSKNDPKKSAKMI